MAFLDILSTSFLFSIAIIILIGGIFAYVNFRMGEQDHKLNSMIGLVSSMAGESQYFRSKLNMLQQKISGQDISGQDITEIDKVQYSSQMMGGEQDKLINVSDEDNTDTDTDLDDDDDETDDDETDDDETDDDETDDDELDDDELDDDEFGEEFDENVVKRLNLTLANEDVNTKLLYEEINDNDFCKKTNNLAVDVIQDLVDLVDLVDPDSTLEETDILLQSEDNCSLKDDFLKNVSITCFDKNIVCLEEIEDIHSNKNDYKKLSLNKLRETVVSKGLIPDASKLKKNELLKLLGDE